LVESEGSSGASFAFVVVVMFVNVVTTAVATVVVNFGTDAGRATAYPDAIL